MINLNNGVANIGNTPGAITDTFANRPATAVTGTIFISTDTQEIYSYSGTNWTLVTTGGGPSTPTGWDTMLAQNEAQTASRNAYINNHSFVINNVAGEQLFVTAANTINGQYRVILGDIGNVSTIGNFIISDTNFLGNSSYLATFYNNVNSGLNFNYVGQVYEIGDMGLNSKGTFFRVNDGAQQISSHWYDIVTSLSYNDGIFLDYSNQTFSFGFLSTGSATQLRVNNNIIGFNNQGIDFAINANFNNSLYRYGAIDVGTYTTLAIDDTAGQSRIYATLGTGLSLINEGFSFELNQSKFKIGRLSTNNYFYIDSSLSSGNAVNYNTFVNNKVQGIDIFLDDFNQIYKTVLGYKSTTGLIVGLNTVIDVSSTLNYVTIGDIDKAISANKFGLSLDVINNDITNYTQALIFDDDGTGNLLQATSGSVSGQHLKVLINGTNYVIELKNP